MAKGEAPKARKYGLREETAIIRNYKDARPGVIIISQGAIRKQVNV